MEKFSFFCVPPLQGERITLHRITRADEEALVRLVESEEVYKLLPTFLFEKRYPDIRRMIDRLYDEGIKESLLLGIYLEGAFCGIAEMYGYKESIRKVSLGYRLLPSYWGRGIATEALRLMVDYLYTKTDIGIITASTMAANAASAAVLKKNGFTLVVRGSDEDWGYPDPIPTDKWIR